MKTQIIKGISLLIGIAMVVSSCKDSNLEQVENNSIQDFSKNYVDETIKTDYVVRNGIVHFKNPETFKKAIIDLGNFSINFRENNKNFKSYNDMVLEGRNKYKKSTSESEKLKILTEYSQYIELNSNLIFPRMLNPFAIFLSTDGIIYVGKMIYYFNENGQTIIFDGDLSKTKFLNDATYKSSSVLKLSNKFSSKSGRISSGCNYLSGFSFGSNSDEQVYAQCGGYFIFDRGGDIPNGFVKVTSMVGTFGGASQTSNTYFDPNISLTVSYKASVIVNGIERGSIEPYYSVGASYYSPYNASSFDMIGSFILTESQLSNNFAEIIIEERYGNVNSSIGGVFYTCN